MNRKIGMGASAVNAVSVGLFALSMLAGSPFLSYFSSMFIAFSFVPMMCGFCFYAGEDRKTAGMAAVGFGCIYAAIILLVYFAQVTTLRLEALTDQADRLLDYQKFSLFFNYDLLGYGMMALATFFAGLTLTGRGALKGMLLAHGIFFFSCLITPMLGVFGPVGAPGVGTLLLTVWCAYFIPVGILSLRFFKKMPDRAASPMPREEGSI